MLSIYGWKTVSVPFSLMRLFFCAQRKASALSSSEVSSSSASSGKDTSCFFLPSFRGWNWPQSIPRISKFSIFYELSKIWRSTIEFNNGNERRKLNKKWERLRVQYQQAGMSEDAIQAMYDFDLGVLNSERSYVANTLAIVDDGDDNTGRKSSDFKQYEKAITVTDTYHETRTRFAWVGEIKDKRLQEGLEKLSDEELRLITLYFRDEYSTVELSKVYGIAQQNISKRILKITKFLKKFGFLGVD